MAGGPPMADRKPIRIAATLLFAGIVFSFLAGMFHPDREPANNHPAVFAEYAASDIWTAVHLGQFIGMTVIVAGLLGLFVALDVPTGWPGWLKRFGAASAVAALALYGVLQAVDGVTLKQAVNAWASAPDGEKAIRFANAEAVRWLEWGVRSYQSFVLGLSFVLFGAAIASTAAISRPVGYLMALAGLAYVGQGWVLGSEGFSSHNAIPTLLGIAFVLLASIWLLIVAWWPKRSEAV